MSPSNLVNNGWLKSLLTAGPIGAIVAFLLLQSAGIIPSTAAEIKETIKQHETQSAQQIKVLQQIEANQRESSRLLQLQCFKQATTDADRRACLGN